MNQKPNIVFLLNDHQSYYGHGEMACGPKIQCPNFEKLAAGGVEFIRAYTAKKKEYKEIKTPIESRVFP